MSVAEFVLDRVGNTHIPYYLTRYVPPLTPMSTNRSLILAIMVYLATVLGLREYMRERPALKLNSLFRLHNIVLSVGSGILLVLTLEQIVPMVWQHGIFYAICGTGAWTARLEFYYIINYYFKFVELLDTVFLALKKKPLTFLHVFHHAATPVIAYVGLGGKTSMSWVPIVLNLAIHVVMYYYYYAAAGGHQIWWKKYLTSMQIAQFVIGLTVMSYGAYSAISYRWLPFLPHQGNCSSSTTSGVVTMGLVSSYLFLFIEYYRKTYKAEFEKRGGAERKLHARGKPVYVDGDAAVNWARHLN